MHEWVCGGGSGAGVGNNDGLAYVWQYALRICLMSNGCLYVFMYISYHYIVCIRKTRSNQVCAVCVCAVSRLLCEVALCAVFDVLCVAGDTTLEGHKIHANTIGRNGTVRCLRFLACQFVVL